jgi:hypothetical protein
MSSHIDRQYIGLIAPRLRLLTCKGDVWNFRCPLCGDSKKNPRLCRGFLLAGRGRITYKCHNCSRAMGFAKFLLQLDPQLAKTYKLDCFKERGLARRPDTTPAPIIPTPPVVPSTLFRLDTLEDCFDSHPAVQYAISRRIPRDTWSRIFVTENMRELESLAPEKYKHVLPEDCRLILPYYTTEKKIVGLTGRSIEASPKKRYIQMRLVEQEPLVFGWPNWVHDQHTYITEGPLDSLFLPNALACGGVDVQKILQMKILDPIATTIIFDHQPRNAEVVQQMRRLVKTGWSVVVWPSAWPYKDINEAIMQGIPATAVRTIIDANTHHGLALDLAIHAWRKC